MATRGEVEIVTDPCISCEKFQELISVKVIDSLALCAVAHLDPDSPHSLLLDYRSGVRTLRTQDTSDPRHFGPRTLRTQDTSDPGHFGTSAEVSVRHFGTGTHVSGHYIIYRVRLHLVRILTFVL